MVTKKGRGRRRKRPAVTAADVMEKMGPEYGPVHWDARLDAASELVYTILSQHTSDINSWRAYDSLMEAYGSIEAIADAPVEDIEEAIRHGGLAAQKAPRIKNVLTQIREEIGSFDLEFLADLPLAEAKAWLTRLNGIGPKTAAIILCFSLGMPAMPVDTHIHRVSKRLGLIGPKVTADKAHDLLEPMVDPEDVFAFHVYLISHGRVVCKALRPLCEECVMLACPSRGTFDAPAKRTKTASKRRAKVADEPLPHVPAPPAGSG